MAERKWTLPDYLDFFAAVKAETGGVRERTLGEVLDAPITPAQGEALSEVFVDFARRGARSRLDYTLTLEYSPTTSAGFLAFPEDHWERAGHPHPSARDARGVAELAATELSAGEREHRVEVFRDTAAFYAELADALEARLAAESGIKRVK